MMCPFPPLIPCREKGRERKREREKLIWGLGDGRDRGSGNKGAEKEVVFSGEFQPVSSSCVLPL